MISRRWIHFAESTGRDGHKRASRTAVVGLIAVLIGIVSDRGRRSRTSREVGRVTAVAESHEVAWALGRARSINVFTSTPRHSCLRPYLSTPRRTSTNGSRSGCHRSRRSVPGPEAGRISGHRARSPHPCTDGHCPVGKRGGPETRHRPVDRRRLTGGRDRCPGQRGPTAGLAEQASRDWRPSVLLC